MVFPYRQGSDLPHFRRGFPRNGRLKFLHLQTKARPNTLFNAMLLQFINSSAIVFLPGNLGGTMRNADVIRSHVKDKYVAPARQRQERRFSIRTGDVLRDLKLTGRAPAICSALKTREFLEENALRLVSKTGPPSGQSTTVTYTYEFVAKEKKDDKDGDRQDAWNRLRGALKDVFAESGGGENYLRAERANFYGPGRDR